MNTTTYTVRYTPTSSVPGYAPSYLRVAGADWETAYEWARATVPAIAAGREYTFPEGRSLLALYTALRDGATEARLEVWSNQSHLDLGRPFTPALLGTITVAQED